MSVRLVHLDVKLIFLGEEFFKPIIPGTYQKSTC